MLFLGSIFYSFSFCVLAVDTVSLPDIYVYSIGAYIHHFYVYPRGAYKQVTSTRGVFFVRSLATSFVHQNCPSKHAHVHMLSTRLFKD